MLTSGKLSASRSPARATVAAEKTFPFLFWHDDSILVPIAANGAGTEGIVDSAAAVSMIDRYFATAARVGLTSAGQSLAGPGGRFRASRTAPFQLSVADRVTLLPWAAVVDLSEVSRAMGWPVRFILGQDVLRQYVFDFRFDTKRFAAIAAEAAFDTSGLVELALGRGVRQEPTIEIEIEGNPPITAAVDTGNSNPLLLSATYADGVGLSKRKSSTGLSATASGLSRNQLISVKSLRLADLEVRDVPTEIYSAWTSNGSPANIGMPLLAGRRLVLDFGKDRLWRTPPAPAALRKDRSGLGLVVRSDRLIVVHVASESPAEAAGWRVNEEITGIDGKQVGLSYNKGDLWRWRFRPAGTIVELKLASGKVKHLRLADYC